MNSFPTPLYLLFLIMVLIGASFIILNNGNLGTGRLAGFTLCLLALVPLVIDRVLKSEMQDRTKVVRAEWPVAIVLAVLVTYLVLSV